MRQVGRSIGALLLGVLVALVAILGFVALGSRLYPLPIGTDPSDTAAIQAAIAILPGGWFVLSLAGWIVGAFLASWIAAAVAGRARIVHGMVLTGLVLTRAILDVTAWPRPMWGWATALVLIPGTGYVGSRLGTPRLVGPVSWAAVGSLVSALILNLLAVGSGLSHLAILRRLARQELVPSATLSQTWTTEALLVSLQNTVIAVTALVFLVWLYRAYAAPVI
jgi:hypothetical protein